MLMKKFTDIQIERYMCKHPYISFGVLFAGLPLTILLAVSILSLITMLPIDLLIR